MAAMSALFHEHRVRATRKDGESEADARKRVMKVVNDNEMVLLLQMVRPEAAALEWVKI